MAVVDDIDSNGRDMLNLFFTSAVVDVSEATPCDVCPELQPSCDCIAACISSAFLAIAAASKSKRAFRRPPDAYSYHGTVGSVYFTI